MANPQIEDGHVDLANEIVEALAKTRISGEEMQCLWVIFRKTYGWHKKKDSISLRQFSEMTLLSRSAACRAIRKLRLKNIIKTENSTIATIYTINKNYDIWSKESLKHDRENIFKRDDYVCFYCKGRFDASQLEVDHLIPLHENGSNKESNLITSCITCNGRRRSDQIVTVSKRSQYQKRQEGCDQNDNEGVTKRSHTKETIQKKLYKRNKYKRNNIERKENGSDKKDTTPEVKVFIDFYFEEFKNRFSNPPLINGGKDGRIVKGLLRDIPIDELKSLLIKFFNSDDKFITESGYTLGIFKSQINKLRIKKNRTPFKPQPGIASFYERHSQEEKHEP